MNKFIVIFITHYSNAKEIIARVNGVEQESCNRDITPLMSL